MRAIKFESFVSPGHTLQIDLPSDVVEGPAEVIVLIPDPQSVNIHDTLELFLEKLSNSPIRGRSKEDIDGYLQKERNSWDA